MSRVERSAIVRRSAADMFRLVDDVEAYPRRFAWCEGSAVLQRDETMRIARLDLRLAGMRASFTTRNEVEADRRITLALVEGPFSDLRGSWDFLPLAAEACRVSLLLDFEVAGRWLGGALASGFRSLADRLVDDFVREARRADAGNP